MSFLNLKTLTLGAVILTSQNLFAQQEVEDTRNLVNLGPNVNSTAIEIHPLISADGKSLFYVREDYEDNSNFQDIWISELDENGKWQPAKKLKGPLNSIESNSVLAVSPDGKKLIIQGFFKKGKFHGKGCSITRLTQDGWSTPEGIEIEHYTHLDKGKYNDVAISNDHKVMIFSFSQHYESLDNDLYISFRKEDGTYTKPEPLPSNINVKGHMEFAPFLASDNKTLYFASDRPGGLGETDIYKTQRTDDTWMKWSDPVNMGKKINGPGRDGYYALDSRGTHAYMVSDKNSIGLADIVMVELEQEHRPDPVVLVKGKTFDAKTNKPIEAIIEFHDYPVDSVNGEANTDHASGSYTITFPYDEKYVITAHAHGYVSSFDTISFQNRGEHMEIIKDYYLTPIVKGEVVVLKHVNFASNSAILEPESYVELDKTYRFLHQNPEVKILIGGHTDNSGTPETNLTLSDNRAKAVRAYLISKGIDPERMEAEGYGQTKPVAPNDTPENMRLNRRVEFTITQE